MTTPALELAARSGEAAKSGPIGLAVILILCVVCYFLFKSMSKHMRRVREQFPAGPMPQPSAAAGRVDLTKQDVVLADPDSVRPATGEHPAAGPGVSEPDGRDRG